MGSEREVLWRCTECGKWSQAKRRPTAHERIVLASILGDEPSPHLIIRGNFDVEPHTGAEVLHSWSVRCGPFEAWTATRGAPSRAAVDRG